MADTVEKALARLKVIIDAEVAPIKSKIESIKKSVASITDTVEKEVDEATNDSKKQMAVIEKAARDTNEQIRKTTEDTAEQIEESTRKVSDEVDKQTTRSRASVKKAMPQITSSVKSHTERMQGMFGGLGKAIKAAFAVVGVAAIVAFGKSCIDLGSDLAEVQNVVDVTFGELSDRADAFALNAMDSYGLSEATAKQYLGTSGAMAKAFGFDNDDALAMSEAITGLTGDVASFYNLSSDAAYTKLKSIFTGETESLKDLGVVMTQTALDGYAMANGFGKTTSEMTEQEKVLLRYQFVMSSLADASGDFARTSEGWANQTRVLSLRFDALKATLGQGLINMLTPAVKLINQLLSRLQAMASYFNQFTAAVFGRQESSTSAVVSDAADVTTDLADSMDSAADSAERLNKAVAGFDKLNIINFGEAASSLGSTASGALSSDLGLNDISENSIDVDTSKIDDKLRKLKELLAPLKDAAAGLWEELKRFGGFTWDSLQGFYDNFLVPLGEWAFGEDSGLTRLVNIVTEDMSRINWEDITRALNDFWAAIEPYAEQFGEGLIDFFEDISDLAVDVINKFPGLLDGITGALNNGDPSKARKWGYAFGVLAAGLLALKAVGNLASMAGGLKVLLTVGVAIAGFEIGGQLYKNVESIHELSDKIGDWIFEDDGQFAVGRTIELLLDGLAISFGAVGIKRMVQAALTKSAMDAGLFASGLTLSKVGLLISLIATVAIESYNIGGKLYENVESIHELSDAIGDWIFEDDGEFAIHRTIGLSLGGLAISVGGVALKRAIQSAISAAMTSAAINSALGGAAAGGVLALPGPVASTLGGSIASAVSSAGSALASAAPYIAASLAAVVGGWNIGQWLYEGISGEEIEQNFVGQLGTMIGSLFDGSAGGALKLWGEDIVEGLSLVGEDVATGFHDLTEAVGKAVADTNAKLISAGLAPFTDPENLSWLEENNENVIEAYEEHNKKLEDENLRSSVAISDLWMRTRGEAYKHMLGILDDAGMLGPELKRILSADSMADATSGIIYGMNYASSGVEVGTGNIVRDFIELKASVRNQTTQLKSNLKSDISEQNISNVLSGLSTGATSAVTAFSTNLSGIDTAAEDIKTSLSTSLSKNNMESAMSGVVDAADSVSRGFANTFSQNINGMLTNLETVEIQGTALNAKAATNKLFAKITKIPAMATGGVVNKPTVAMVGEAGAEAVMPLENNTGWMNRVAALISNRITGNSDNIDYERLAVIMRQAMESANVVAKVAAGDVNKAVVNEDKKFRRQTGHSQFVY